jgi:hypothetical protein
MAHRKLASLWTTLFFGRDFAEAIHAHPGGRAGAPPFDRGCGECQAVSHKAATTEGPPHARIEG